MSDPVLTSSPPTRTGWWRMFLSLGLGGLGVWLLAGEVALADVFTAAGRAHLGYTGLAIVVVFVIPLVKAWRWQWLLAQGQADGGQLPLGLLTRILFIGMFWGQILPLARLGEVSRLVLLGGRVPRAQILGTLVVEKVLEVVMVVLSLLLILPLVAMPPQMGQPTTLALLAGGLLVGLAAVAYLAEPLSKLAHWLTSRLPFRIANWMGELIDSGLQGLLGLRHGRSLGRITAASALITFMYFLPAYFLFLALDIPLGFVVAVLLNGVLLLGLIPSSAPGNIGVFEFLCLAVLRPFGAADEATLLGFALLFHAIVILPQLLGGVLSAWGGGR